MLSELLVKMPDLLSKLKYGNNFDFIPRTAQFWDSQRPELRDFYVLAAEKYKNFEWPVLKASGYLDFSRTGNRDRFQSFYYERRTALMSLVMAEMLCGTGEYIDDIINGIWTVCEESGWAIPAHNLGDPLPKTNKPVIDLFAAETGATAAWVYYLLKDKLDAVTPIISQRIQSEVKTRILDPYLDNDDFWWMGYDRSMLEKLNNWTPWCNASCLCAFLIMENDPSRMSKFLERFCYSLDRFLDIYHANKDDGGCDEGPSYWFRAGGALLDCLDMLSRASDGAFSVFDEPLIKRIGQFICNYYIGDGYFINYADCGPHLTPGVGTIFSYGKRIGDEKMASFAAWYDRKNGGLPLSERGFTFMHRLRYILLEKELEAQTPALPFIREYWYDGIEVLICRKADDCPDGLFLSAKGGNNGESHNHNDVGSFVLYDGGTPVIIDLGVETYRRETFNEKRYTIWTMKSEYHNLPTVDGVNQIAGRDRKAKNVQYLPQGEKTVFSLDIDGAYPEEAGIKKWRRTFEYDRAENNMTLRDLFDFVCEKPFTLSFMLAKKPEISGSGIDFGSVEMSFDGSLFDPVLEECPIEDKQLRGAWGERVWRLLLKSKKAVSSCDTSVLFKKK